MLRERGATPVNLAILFMLYTGARRKEVLEAEWQYIDFGRREWRIPITKNGQPRTVILSGKAMEILQHADDYQERNFQQPVGIVFANPKTLQPYYNIWETWKRV
ncbi:tyrosine-type recombinase/integrase, partial [Rhodosalinus sp. FB01]|uniref:tyrosine-type recombinase/integrase n=1 Tax=Rhodosalinus sp. FB01 TaxID=3239194 RepID=UPI0035237D23